MSGLWNSSPEEEMSRDAHPWQIGTPAVSFHIGFVLGRKGGLVKRGRGGLLRKRCAKTARRCGAARVKIVKAPHGSILMGQS